MRRPVRKVRLFAPGILPLKRRTNRAASRDKIALLDFRGKAGLNGM